MGNGIESPRSRRIFSLRRRLTVSLYLREGEFWEAIQASRERFKVAPSAKVPTTAETWGERYACAPSLLGNRVTLQHWRRAVRDLEERFVPANLWATWIAFPPTAGKLWEDFLESCILHDPPGDQLQDFARHVNATPPDGFDPFSDPQFDWANGAMQEPLYLIAPPFRLLFEPIDVYRKTHAFYQHLIGKVHDDLTPSGVDVVAAFERARQEYKAHANVKHYDAFEFLAHEARPYIEFDDDSTEEDVLAAYRALAAMRATRGGVGPKATKPRRDLLTCIQCAVWYNDYGWSLEQIGKHQGWAIQYPEGAKPRCETARQHIVEGRRLLKERPKKEAA